MRWLAIAVLGACTFHGGHAATGDAGSGALDAALDAPIDTASDAPSDAPGDRDGDGVPDVTDDCPDTPDPKQLDFDGDHIGDACDHCPHLASATDPDTDGDGVGDACDPRPTLPGDQRVVWNAFRDADEIAGWSSTDGTWTLTAGGISQADTTKPRTGFGPATMFNHLYVATEMTFDGAGTAMDRIAGVAPGDIPNQQYYACSALLHFNTSYAAGFSLWSGVPQNSAFSMWGGTLVGGTFDIVDTSVGSMTCQFAQPGQTSGTVNVPNGLGPTTGQLFVYTQYAAATFRYVFAVEIGS